MNEETVIEIQPKPIIKYGWLRAVLYLIATLITTVIFSSIGLVFTVLVFGMDITQLMTDAKNIIKDLGLPANIIITFSGFLGMLLMTWIFRRFIDKKSFKSLGFEFKLFRSDFIRGFIIGLVLISVGFLTLILMDFLTVTEVRFNFMLFIGYIVFLTVVSLNEEIMIRGYFLSNFCESMNRYIALLISSLIFALMHLGNANVTVLSFINIFLAGILLGIYYIYRQNLWLPISLHFIWNFMQGPVCGFEVSGVETTGIFVQDIKGSELWTGGAFGFEGSLLASILMILAILYLHFKYRN